MTTYEPENPSRLNRLKESGDLPNHLAIIMDGNSRWADQRGLSIERGHREGVRRARQVADICAELGSIPILTLFAFSTENWGRPSSEIQTLINLLQEFLEEERPRMVEQGVRFEVIGDQSPFPSEVQDQIQVTREATRDNETFRLNLALNYGGRDEITRAVKNLVEDVEAGELESSEITDEIFGQYLDTADIPDPDLLIRTSGEYRISNFLLWQLAYTEMVFPDVYWPAFDEASFLDCLERYRERDRRFGQRHPREVETTG